MDIGKIFLDLNDSLKSHKDKVRSYIGNAHWPTDGEWKERVLRKIIAEKCPNAEVGTGFVLNNNGHCSTQIDVIIYDKTSQVIFKDRDFVIVSPESVRCLIEVKTVQTTNKLKISLKKLSDAKEFVEMNCNNKIFSGIFIYDKGKMSKKNILKYIKDSANGNEKRVIKCLAIGEDHFVRYWSYDPMRTNNDIYNYWHLYGLTHKSYAYFIHNIIEHLEPEWVKNNSNINYPSEGKENSRVEKIALL